MDAGDVGGKGSLCKDSSSCSTRHKRSKSASEKISEFTNYGTVCIRGDSNERQKLVKSAKPHATRGTVCQDSICNICNTSLNHRASLENDIEQLQVHLHQEKSVRVMLEKAIGRASSTLSPGHRHFASQTRELLTEIETLEEEIANREQHVLSLYRSFFDQCVSGTTSAHSSGRTSPAHRKNGARKHPSIISGAFCSSKKFPLQTFQVLGTIKESGNSRAFINRKGRAETRSNGKASTQVGGENTDPMKLPTLEGSYIARTLKDHLHQCPSRLSEELLRCMAAIYCWIRTESFMDSEVARSPILSRSSTSVILPKRSSADDREKEWSCRSTVEISSISVDKNSFSSASYAINNYRLLVENLERIDISALESSAKLAFWLNAYNSLIMHAYLAFGIPHTSLRRLSLFHKAAYNIGGSIFSANTIEHSILCCRTPRSGRWFETIISTAMRKRSGEEKQLLNSKIGLFCCQPLVLFGLCTGAASDPMVLAVSMQLRVYTPKNVIEELEKAKKEFLQANVVVKKSRKVFLSKILDRYAKEANMSSDDLFTWMLENVDKKLHEAIQKCVNDSKSKKKASQVIEWLPYNTRFRYVFGKDLTEKPWWV